MVTRWKVDNNVFILLKMYWMTFSYTSGNVQKIATNENGAKFPRRYSNVHAKAYGNLW